MNDHQRILATFRREPVDRIVWQPRLYYWYYANRIQNRLPDGWHDEGLLKGLYATIREFHGTVPEVLQKKSLLEIYRALDSSPRYAPEVLGVEILKQKQCSEKVKTQIEKVDNVHVTQWKTPHGTLTQRHIRAAPLEYAVKSVDDFPALLDILEATIIEFDTHAYSVCCEAFGDDGVVQAFHPRTPIQKLFHEFMGLDQAIYLLYTEERKVRALLRDMESLQDDMYTMLADTPLPIVAFGENLDANYLTPAIFEEHMLPYYQKRLAQMHSAGKFCHIHADGSLKAIVNLLGQVGFDGIEAPTPEPQGDVTIEELKEALGDTIILDGVPAVLFCPHYPMDTLLECVQTVLDTFAPKLILGASDEVPPDADIERVAAVSRFVANYSQNS